MSNLLNEVKIGMEGRKFGITTGSPLLDKLTLGIRKGVSGAIIAAEKAGKSKFLRYHYIIMPYINCVLKGKQIRWHLFSLEEPRYKVEADICSALIYKMSHTRISKTLMLGEQLDNDGKPVLMTSEQLGLVKKCYYQHIIPLFGEYSNNGDLIKEGLIVFHGTKVTPGQYEGILLDFAEKHGNMTYKIVPEKLPNGTSVNKKIIHTFVPHKKYEDLVTIVLMDDYRLMKKESGNKDTIDRALEVEVDLGQTLKWYFFMGVIHTNRTATDYKRIEAIGANRYFPDTSTVKDTGNVGERKTFAISLYDPTSTGMNTPTHFNQKLPLDGTYRSIHLVASREVRFPQHARLKFQGDILHFTDYKLINQ